MASAAVRTRHLAWVDGTKALSILWIAFFHFFDAWQNKTLPSPLRPGYVAAFATQCAPEGAIATLRCAAEGALGAFGQLGFHAVSIFLVMSGFGLAASAAGKASIDWREWFRSRFLRLYPMYWAAHAIVFVAPFAFRPEAIDARIVPSLLGLRFWPPISANFYYVNAAWWYFGLLIQLYAAFPLLWWAMRGMGPLPFFVATAAITLAARWMMLFAWPVDGLWVQGGFFAGRLVEFAGGMVLGALHRARPAEVEARLFAPSTLLAGAAVYALAIPCHHSLAGYLVSDALVAAGLFVLIAALARWIGGDGALSSHLMRVGAFSYGLYLLHQPFVITIAMSLRDWSMFAFVAIAIPILALLTAIAIQIERAVNTASDRLLR